MRLLETHEMTAALEKDVRGLETLCLAADAESPKLYIDKTLNRHPLMNCYFTAYEESTPVAFAFAFAPTSSEVEITVIVHPDFRRQGYFRRMVEAVCKEAKRYNYKDLLLVVQRNCMGGAEAAKAISKHIHLSHSEYQMLYAPSQAVMPVTQGMDQVQLLKAGTGDVSDLATVISHAFNDTMEDATSIVEGKMKDAKRAMYKLVLKESQIVGTGCIKVENDRAMLFGLAIDPAHQGKRLGRALLERLVELGKSQADQVGLEVDSMNHVAFKLYSSAGFVVESACDYYRMPCAELDTQL